MRGWHAPKGAECPAMVWKWCWVHGTVKDDSLSPILAANDILSSRALIAARRARGGRGGRGWGRRGPRTQDAGCLIETQGKGHVGNLRPEDLSSYREKKGWKCCHIDDNTRLLHVLCDCVGACLWLMYSQMTWSQDGDMLTMVYNLTKKINIVYPTWVNSQDVLFILDFSSAFCLFWVFYLREIR